MVTSGDPKQAIDRLEELFVHIHQTDGEELRMQMIALHMVQAQAATHSELTPIDHELFALLLSRWTLAWKNLDLEPSDLDGALDISASPLAGVLSASPSSVEHSLRRLEAARLITLRLTATGEGTFTLEPVFAQIADRLMAMLERDRVDRHGEHLRWLAENHLESVGNAIEELLDINPSASRVQIVRTEFEAFAASRSAPELLREWPAKPAAAYAWLEELARFEERTALLGGNTYTPLKSALADLSETKLLILSGQLPTRPAPANAA